MRPISPQHYKTVGQQREIDPVVLKNSVAAIRRIEAVSPQLFPLLTLNHLSHETGLSYAFLRAVVGRQQGRYRHFYMKKRVPGRQKSRMISIPDFRVRICQKWICDNILKHGEPHPDSYAYHPASNPVNAAWVHTSSHWLIKADIQDFFHAITEHQVFAVFQSLGYSRLISFELARLCTMSCERRVNDTADEKYYDSVIQYYQSPNLGILPQGAPTSPMLSNLVMRKIDADLSRLAAENCMRYSRYADDIVFSCKEGRARTEINRMKRSILQCLNDGGFRPNLRKTVVRGPGDRKIVLGLLVDSKSPRLPREYKDKVRLHLHYLGHPNFGPAHHAAARNMSVAKLYHHVFGLICWARAVEPKYGEEALKKFNSVSWPPISRPKFYAPAKLKRAARNFR